MPITIRCNGQPKEIPEGTNVSQLVDLLGVRPKRFAVEVNRQVVPAKQLENVTLEDGDEVNVVTLVGGG